MITYKYRETKNEIKEKIKCINFKFKFLKFNSGYLTLATALRP